jgi:hypothetical protein
MEHTLDINIKNTVEWAKKVRLIQNNFYELLKKKNIIYIFPWKTLNIKCGNTTKVHYMELFIHHLNNTATVNFYDNINKGFFGIKNIFVNKKQQSLFDEGYIPSITGTINTYTKTKIKTLKKIWYNAGFIERKINDGIFFEFDQYIYNNMKQQMQNDIKKRKNKNNQLKTKIEYLSSYKLCINYIIN